MRNIKLIIKYDGTKFKGWQRLKNDENTLQGKIEDTLSMILDEKVEIIGSGRTDGGVHALGQVANFKTASNISIKDLHHYLYTYLPTDIVVEKIVQVEDRFHSRYNAKAKTYQYKVYNHKYHDPFLKKYSEHVKDKLNIDSMKKASEYLIGEHDFTSFAASKSKKKSNVRTIYSIDIVKSGKVIDIVVRGNGFLYNMVRIIAGTLIEVGQSNIPPERMKDILNSKKRSLAGQMASSKGLYLVEVEY